MHISKTALDLSDYAKYEIDQYYQAYKIEILNIDQHQLDQYEQDLMFQGLKLFHTETVRVDGGVFNALLIVGKSSTIYSSKKDNYN